MTSPPSAPSLDPAENFVPVPLRPRFFEASAFFPMPIVLLGTRGADGAVNLAPYSLCFPQLARDGHRMELLAKSGSKTAANLARTGRASINFIPDQPDYLACCKELSAPVPTAEKMAKSLFKLVPVEGSAGLDGSAPPPLVAEAVQSFDCRLLQSEPWGDGDLRLLLEVEGIRMQRYWARMLDDGRSGPRLPVDYGFRMGAATWMSRPVVVALGPRLRPEFVIQSARPTAQIIDDLRAALQRPDANVTGKIRGDVVQLNIPPAEVITWSPSMELSVEADGAGSKLYVRIGPQPQIWTTFMFLHLLIAMFGLAGIMWGLAHAFMGEALWPFWIPLGALFLHAFVAGAAFIGQGLGADQIYRLRTFLSDVLGP